jgi:hypothetical protein
MITVIAFDELNVEDWRGKSIAVIGSLKWREYRIERCSFGSVISLSRANSPDRIARVVG